MLEYRCPALDRQVRTEIATTVQVVRRLGRMKLSLWCPHCQAGHIVCASETQVVPRS